MGTSTVWYTDKPSRLMITRILNDEVHISRNAESQFKNSKKEWRGRSTIVEETMIEWVWDMWVRQVFISDGVIQAKAQRVLDKINARVLPENRINMKFSNGWLYRFKKRNDFRRYISHGESAGVNEQLIQSQLPIIQAQLSLYETTDIFNADELGLFYNLPPKSIVGPGRLAGLKKVKHRVTYLACCNATGTERLPFLVIGSAKKQRCFQNRNVADDGLMYRSTPNA